MSASKKESVKILWVHDEFEGPMNVLAEYKGEKVWFNRVDTRALPSVVSSTDVPVPSEGRTYTLKRIDPNYLERVLEHNHKGYCEETGAPLFHGDPTKIRKRVKTINKMDIAKAIPPGEETLEVTQRTLSSVKKFEHIYDPLCVPGEVITTVKEMDFVNYLVPHRIEIE